MALTVSTSGDWSRIDGNQRRHNVTLAFDSSYPTGGETLTAAAVGLGMITDIEISPNSGGTFTVETTLPATSVTVLAYVPGATVGADGAEQIIDTPLSGVASTTAQSIGVVDASETFRFGLMKEVADTEDLSSITGVRCRVWGY